MILPLSRRLPVFALSLTLAACSSAPDEPRIATSTPATGARARSTFVGTIHLLEEDYLVGSLRNTSYITLTFDGHRLRRDVRMGGFTADDFTHRYGIITDLRTDSVTYYLQNDQRNVHCRLSRTDYLARVAANEPILSSLDLKPYSTKFEQLPPATPGRLIDTPPSAAQRRLNLQTMLFELPDKAQCKVLYSDQIRLPKKVLAYLDYQPPAAVPQLALSVHYTMSQQAKKRLLRDVVLDEVFNPYRHQSGFASLDTTIVDDAFELPSGSRNGGSDQELNNTISSEGGGSSGHHHHH